MGATENSKQPWVDWVKGRERQLELVTSMARVKIEERLRRSEVFDSYKRGNRYIRMGASRAKPRLRCNEPGRMSASSCGQHEQFMWAKGQQSAELRRAPLLKRELKQCPEVAYVVDTVQLLPHLKSDGTALQEVTTKNVVTTASKAPPFNTSCTTFDGSCHSASACTASRHTLVESSHPKGRECSGEILEVGHSQSEHKVDSNNFQAQSNSLTETLGAGCVRASGAEHHAEGVLALSRSRRVLEPVVCYPEELPMNQSMKETDRPVITWLKGATKKSAGARKSKSDVMTLLKSFDWCQSSKDFGSSSRYCVACTEHVNSQQFQMSEPVQRRVRKHVDWHLPERDNLPFRKREKTRCGLSCHLLGEASDAESQGRTSRNRRTKREVCAVDLRPDVQRKSSKEKRQNLRRAQTPMVVSLERFFMELLNDEEEVRQCWLSAPETLEVGSDKDFTRNSIESLVEDGLLEASQPSNRKGDPSSPPHSFSTCSWPHMDAFTTVPSCSNELLRGEPDESPDEFLFEPINLNEDDEKKIRKVTEMQRLAGKVLDALLVDVAVELSRMCTSVVENLITREFGDIGQ